MLVEFKEKYLLPKTLVLAQTLLLQHAKHTLYVLHYDMFWDVSTGLKLMS